MEHTSRNREIPLYVLGSARPALVAYSGADVLG